MSHARTETTVRLRSFLAMTLPEDAAVARLRAVAAKSAEGRWEEVGVLTRAVRAGDARAFARFYDLHGFRVYKHLLVLAKGDENVAREIFQTVAIKLAKKMEIFDEERALRAWLQSVARNAFIDLCRTRKREAKLLPMDEIEVALEPGTGSPDRLREGLNRALAECAPEEREWLNAIYVDGKSVGEVAAQSGQSYKALESRLARLRLKVRKNLLTQLRHE